MFRWFHRDLFKNGGRFKINSDFIDNNDNDDLFPELETGEELPETIPSPWQLSFNELRVLMKPLPAPNQTIYRKLIKEGKGASYVAGEKCRVTIHYSGYWERATQPFDSTFLQGQPLTFHPGKEEILLGIELAVLSMCVGEESQFVIPYQFLFGELGCPQRIQPRADGLFSIHLLKITQVGDESAVDQISQSDRTKFSVVLPKAKDVYMNGKDLFARHEFNSAIRMFHKAVNSLECCKLANEAEQREQTDFLIKMYTNLAVCYNKSDMPKKACLMCNEIERISPISRNCKALFQHGRALLKLGEFQRAQIKLTQARRMQPSNPEISKELKLLSGMLIKHAQAEKDIWQRAFGNQQATKKTKKGEDVDSLTSQLASITLECLNDFEKNPQMRQMTFPAGLTNEELNRVAELIRDRPIEMDVAQGQSTGFILRKTNQA